MEEQIQALEQNQAWIIEDLLPKKKLINYKWVYKVKYKADGTIEQFKARLVVRGYQQLQEFAFKKTFASIARMTSVWIFLSVKVAKG